MNTIVTSIQATVAKGIQELYGLEVDANSITCDPTRPEFTGDYTIVTFPLVKKTGKQPDLLGQELGQYLVANLKEVAGFNVIKGFLNVALKSSFWTGVLQTIAGTEDYGQHPSNGGRVIVEYCSPNTNKPIHLGHIRNILLGWSTARLLEAAGYGVSRVQVINDRGIAICKSMLAWQRFAAGATPTSSGIKADHFVGHWYVRFEQEFQSEYKAWQETHQAAEIAQKANAANVSDFFKGYKNTYFNEFSDLGKEARTMLLAWEAGDEQVMALWNQMNGWVYEGFNKTFETLGVSFDKNYYESQTYTQGKDIIQKGLSDGVFYQKEDGSIWIDLSDAGLDHKLVLRSDGTSVYITQDIGLAWDRYKDYGTERMVYVVADEQNYHFQVLFEIQKRLQAPFAEGLYHLNYGMVELPSGRMKSREGTVVDADDLIAEITEEALAGVRERGNLAELTEAQQQEISHRIAMAAIKYFILKVGPRKKMVFDPSESLDLQGNTGPYIQNAYVRGLSVARKLEPGQVDSRQAWEYIDLDPVERALIAQLYAFPTVIKEAAEAYDPSALAAYTYDVAKAYHRFYHEMPIMRAENEAAKAFRMVLSEATGRVLQKAAFLLGFEMPDKM